MRTSRVGRSGVLDPERGTPLRYGEGVNVAAVRKIKDLTGPGHTDRFQVGGTDLGVTVAAPDGRLVSVFGDTFEKAGVGGRGWRSPVVLFADPASVDTGIEWAGAAGSA
ncbi:MAG: DUF4185 domain-containing protein, partial [Acidobacteria bacterium]|nr:DUF4185 domain-containing protein [Acidobacteriota bacterium]